MSANLNTMRPYLQKFDFKGLFINELNWGISRQRPWVLELESAKYQIIPLIEQGGLVVFEVTSLNDGLIPDYATRRKIETKVKSQVHEHILIFVNKTRNEAVWQWVSRGAGKSAAAREHHFFKGQPGDSLLQKLVALGFDFSELDEEGKVPIPVVTGRVSKALDMEKVTKRFYDEFKTEHDFFCKFLKGLEKQDDLEWYASVMLNRLMFIYFIQKKGFLNGDNDYLRAKLKESQKRGKDQYFKGFLARLFFEGFAKEARERSLEVNQLLGKVPYLNGGLFLPHQLEQAYGQKISINDAAFERIFTFFEGYNWHLDYRPLKKDDEINPDVLGYIFEKYINQKQMGAYYTKEDITDYISKNTIIPFLFDKLAGLRPSDLQPFPITDVDPYIYDAVKQEEYLPTETDREYQTRRKRYEQIKADFADGKITGINDLITYNLDVRSFASDWVNNISNPLALRSFYFDCLTKVTVLDPTVGSGAFLFAALNILEPLYEICLDKMQELGDPINYLDFAKELKRVNLHPNRRYFVLKSIIINNLFGVDIMEEAVEICKLRLFLKLVAQVGDVEKIEPLPDIDFNIRAGNTLVGYASEQEINKAKITQLDLSGALGSIDNRVKALDLSLELFREMQTKPDIKAIELNHSKAEVKAKLSEIQNELDRDVFAYYGARDFDQFKRTHQPFHWIVEFHSVMKNGGFDVIIGNPPYVSYSKTRRDYGIPERVYSTEPCGNLYAFVMEKALELLRKGGRVGLIVPIASVSTEGMRQLQDLYDDLIQWHSHYAVRPGKLFVGVDMNLTITLIQKFRLPGHIFVTSYRRWSAGNVSDRPFIFSNIIYTKYLRLPNHANPLPKIGSDLENDILSKMHTHGHKVKHFIVPHGNQIYYHSGGRYWRKALPQKLSSHYKPITVARQYYPIILALLNSQLFYWYWISNSNCMDVVSREVNEFPVFELDKVDPLPFQKIVDSLIQSYYSHAETRKRIGARINVEELNFDVQQSKAIIDKIDQALGEHYGFTAQELDFILNYDLKYRMGKDGDDLDGGS